MPMGLTNSPATFQRLMEIALRGLQWHTCLIYLDDIVVFGNNFEEHLKRVEEVLQRLQFAGLKLKPEKCQLFQTEVDFLGHLVSAQGIKPNPHNVSKIQQWPIPTNVTGVRQILGLGNYYRRFVKNYSSLVRPLTELTRKGVDFKWTAACDEAFYALKQALIGTNIMAYPKETGLFILDTDASDYQVAGILSQVQDGRERVISYGSRTLGKAEKNYCITDKELLAIRNFVEYYRQYLLGRKFVVRSDHQALVWLFRLKEPKGRIARWIEILSEYDFSIEYRPGNKHANADALSRCPYPWDCQCSDSDNLEQLRCGPCNKCEKRTTTMCFDRKQSNTETNQTQLVATTSPDHVRVVATRSKSARFEQVDNTSLAQNPHSSDDGKLNNSWSDFGINNNGAQLQQEDPDIKWIIDAVRVGSRPKHSDVIALNPNIRHYWSIWQALELLQNGLFKRFHKKNGTGCFLQFIVPASCKTEILHQMHTNILSGHMGEKKTREKTLQRFYWFGIRDDIRYWIKTCIECQANKKPPKSPKAPLGDMSVGAPLDRLATDYLGPFPVTPRGNRYILTVTDQFSKWVEIFPLPDQSAEKCAITILNEVISRYGCPLSIHSDQGRNYESKLFQELCRMLEIRKTRTSVRNPKCNGQAERFNRTLLSMIKAYLKGEQENWDLNLGCLASTYRATPQESTGLTPNLLMLGRETKLPVELVYGSHSSASRPITNYGQYVDTLRERMQRAHSVARQYLKTNTIRQKEVYDAKLVVNKYEMGNVVWVLNESRIEGLAPKLQPTYFGPCVVIQKINDLIFKIQLNKHGKVRIVHHNKLKPYEGTDYPAWISKKLGDLRINY